MTGVAFWRTYCQSKFVGHSRRLLDVMEKRLLPVFDNIAEAAEDIQRQAYERGGDMPWSEDCGPASLAEEAFSAGQDHYNGMNDGRQALLNSFAVVLYHAWEQQVLLWHRREVLGIKEQHDQSLYGLPISLIDWTLLELTSSHCRAERS